VRSSCPDCQVVDPHNGRLQDDNQLYSGFPWRASFLLFIISRYYYIIIIIPVHVSQSVSQSVTLFSSVYSVHTDTPGDH